MTPWQTPEMERAHTNLVEKAVCPLPPRNDNEVMLNVLRCQLTY